MIVARLKSHSRDHFYFVATDGRVLGGKRGTKESSATGTKVARKPGHLYYVDGAGAVHETKPKGR